MKLFEGGSGHTGRGTVPDAVRSAGIGFAQVDQVKTAPHPPRDSKEVDARVVGVSRGVLAAG